MESIFGYVKLGKNEARSDAKNLKLANYFDRKVALPGLPVRSRHAVGIKSFPMYGNDLLSDCTCATAGHGTMVRSYRDGKSTLLIPSEQDVLALYWATGSADDGRYLDQVLNYWRQNPLPTLPSPTAYVQVEPKDEQMVKAGIHIFGGVAVGIGLPVAAQQMTAWDIPEGQALTGDWEPWGWGGHAFHMQAYNPRPRYHYDYVGTTWAQRISISQRFLDAYADEVFALYHPLWLEGGVSPAGFDDVALMADLAQVTKH